MGVNKIETMPTPTRPFMLPSPHLQTSAAIELVLFEFCHLRNVIDSYRLKGFCLIYLKYNFKKLCVYNEPVCFYVQEPREVGDGIGSPGTGVEDNCELPSRC